MLNLTSILLFSEDPERLSAFYEKIFEKGPEWEDGGYYSFQTGLSSLTIGPHNKVKGKNKEPQRIMINFETPDVENEFEMIKKRANPKVIAEPYAIDGENMMIATFEDPDGNYFQLITPFEIDLSKN